MGYKEKFIGFVDILGFKSLVEKSEKGAEESLDNIMGLLELLGSRKHIETMNRHGPTICPNSHSNNHNLDFQLTQISDCVVVSTELSPSGVINLVGHCWGSVINLLHRGVMCRGFITKGLIYHTDSHLIGSGYQNAYEKESEVSAFRREADERGTPFVEVDNSVCEYIGDTEDHCVKEMFSRMVETDGNVTALYPFKRLGHSFVLMGSGASSDLEKEKHEVQKVRAGISWLKKNLTEKVNSENRRAVAKLEHYIRALDSQLEACDRTDDIINIFNQKGVP